MEPESIDTEYCLDCHAKLCADNAFALYLPRDQQSFLFCEYCYDERLGRPNAKKYTGARLKGNKFIPWKPM